MRTNTVLTNISRLGFIAWLTFEILNWLQVLHFTLDFTWRGLIMTSAVVWGMVEIVSALTKRWTGKPLPWFVFFGALFSTSVDAIGDIEHWYIQFDWYDQMAHALGGGMAALLVFFVFWQLVHAGKIFVGKKLAGFMSFSAAAFLGVCYELEEYIEDVITHGNRLGNGVDTANDLMWNTIGAVAVVVVLVALVKQVGEWRVVKKDNALSVVSSEVEKPL